MRLSFFALLTRSFAGCWLLTATLSVAALAGCGSTSEGPGGGDGDGDGGGDGDGDLVVEDQGDGDGTTRGCEKQQRLDAVSVGGPAPFDVIIVADHSESLSWSRDDLAAGLSDFLGQVRGHEVRFFVLTPTQYGQTSEAAHIPGSSTAVVPWQDPQTGLGFENPMTRYENECWDGQEPMTCPTTSEEAPDDFSLLGTWHFAMPDPIAAITPDMDNAALDAQRTAISDAILNLGLGGSSIEQPLCTLHRYLKQNPQPLPDHAIFIVISDEDDTSLPGDCLKSYSVYSRVSDAPSRFLIQSQGPRSQAQFQCTPIDDQGQVIGPPVNNEWNEAGCTAARACGQDDLQLARDVCPGNFLIENCQVECYTGVAASCLLEESDTVSDACNSPFEYGSVLYDNLLDYCITTRPEIAVESWQECKYYATTGTRSFGQNTKPLPSGTDTGAMVVKFKDEADRVFGAAGYAVQLIGFDPDFSCQPQTGQSYLNHLKGLVDSEEDIFPICADYAGALGQAESFATNLVQSKYQLDLDSEETLTAVSVVAKDDSTRQLSADEYTFEEASGLLTIEVGALRATDVEIELSVLEDCEIR